MAVRFPRLGNPHYPLPPDWEDLDERGRRLARLNAVALRETPEDMMHAWHYFRNYYLRDPACGFYKGFKDSPSMHYEMVSFFRRYTLNAIAAPRASAKSTVMGTEVPMMEIISPMHAGMDVALFLAKDEFVEQRFDKIMMQLEENQRIRDDFGRLRPGHGEGIWNRHTLRLTNSATLRGYSIDGKKRGARPDIAIVDDPEYDASEGTNVERVNRDMESMLMRQILGMLDPGARLFWIGTLLSQRSFLYHILHSQDPRFTFWNKRLYSAEYTDAEGEQQILWPTKWTKEFLDHKRQTMGIGAYQTEFLNDPRSDAEAILVVDSVLNEYTSREYDPIHAEQTSPFVWPYRIQWNETGVDPDGAVTLEERDLPYPDFLGGLKRYITVDYAPTTEATSDFSCIMVLGIDRRNTVWVLDGWHGKVRSNVLVKLIWQLAHRWHVRLCGVEAVSVQDTFRQQVADFMASTARQGEFTPAVVPIRYPPNVSKAQRIEGLEWRFMKGRIKYPVHMKLNRTILQLYHQTEYFTPDLARLSKDDIIDAVSMIHYLLPGGSRECNPSQPMEKDLVARLEKGELYLTEHPGVSILSGVMPSELTDKAIEQLRLGAGSRPNETIHAANEFAPYHDEYDTGQEEDAQMETVEW